MINNDKTQSEWKIQLTMQINLICSKDYKETHTTHSKSHNIECIIMMGNETDEIIEKKLILFCKNIKKDSKNQ